MVEGAGRWQQELVDQRLRLPAVDTVVGSKLADLKELRADTSRVLFVFDPRRAAILMPDGDKRRQWEPAGTSTPSPRQSASMPDT